jgi:2'-5' RNA ligase
MTDQEPAIEPNSANEQIRWTVQILLPENADRELQRKTDKTPGASWPAWGGHMTLLPMCTSTVDENTLQEAVAQAVAGFGPMEIELSNFAVEQDLTRPDYCAVFLTLGDGQEQTLEQLRSLRNRIFEATRTLRKDLWPALESSEFVPHVTLAMGLSESEANAVVRQLRAEGLSVHFRLKEVLLLGFAAGGGAEPIRAYSFPLSAPAAYATDVAPESTPVEQANSELADTTELSTVQHPEPNSDRDAALDTAPNTETLSADQPEQPEASTWSPRDGVSP